MRPLHDPSLTKPRCCIALSEGGYSSPRQQEMMERWTTQTSTITTIRSEIGPSAETANHALGFLGLGCRLPAGLHPRSSPHPESLSDIKKREQSKGLIADINSPASCCNHGFRNIYPALCTEPTFVLLLRLSISSSIMSKPGTFQLVVYQTILIHCS